MNATDLSIYSRAFDQTNKHWHRSSQANRIFIQCQEAYANDVLQARGHIFLNEIYDMLGFERTKDGAVMGWFKSEGSNRVKFDMFKVDLLGTEVTAYILDFNPDGIIYDKLP